MSDLLRVLLLGAEPSDAPQFGLEKELDRLVGGKALRVLPIRHTHFDQVAEAIDRIRPHLLQFTGHGQKGGKLVFEKQDGHYEIVDGEAVALLLSRQSVRRWVRGVVLNSCYTEPLAKRLIGDFDFAIGSSNEIKTEAAMRFSAGFYRAMDRGDHLNDAFLAGAAGFASTQPQNRPQLLMAEGVAARGYRLRLSPNDKPFVYFHFHPSDKGTVDEFRKRLRPRKSEIDLWGRDELIGGTAVADGVSEHLERANLIVTVQSVEADADADWTRWSSRAMARHDARTAQVLPLVARPVELRVEVKELDLLYPGGKALSMFPARARDSAWLTICERFFKHVNQVKEELAALRVEVEAINAELPALIAAAMDRRAEAPRPATVPPSTGWGQKKPGGTRDRTKGKPASTAAAEPSPRLPQQPTSRPRSSSGKQPTAASGPSEAELLDRLVMLLPAQFDEMVFRLEIPIETLSHGTAQVTRAIEVLRYLKQTKQMDRLVKFFDRGR